MKKIREYRITAFRSVRGHDGQGFNSTLSRMSKKVAFVDDDGWGGGFAYTWLDEKDGLVEYHTVDYKGEPFVRKVTNEEKIFLEAINDLTYVCQFDGKVMKHSEDTAVDMLIEERDFNNKAKKVTLFSLKSEPYEWRYVKAPYDSKVEAFLTKKYGDNLKSIYNRDGIGLCVSK